MPLEGELDRPETLIPFKWFCGELARCPARQKVLILDVCRLNPVSGAEDRYPGHGDAMGPKLAAADQVAPPPAGVPDLVRLRAGAALRTKPRRTRWASSCEELQAGLERASEGKLKLQDHIQEARTTRSPWSDSRRR